VSESAMARLEVLLPSLNYDICVLTGDFRGATYGPFEAVLMILARLRGNIRSPVYGVLGNHDSARMLSRLEAMDIRMLMNETEVITRQEQRIHIAGIDDAHFYRTEDIGKAAASIPREEFSVLLSHTPATYHQAADAKFNLFLSGHTHGGQICLPGGIPVTLNSNVPRSFGSGAWRYHDLQGYTSVGVGTGGVPVRLNCMPEVTLHYLRRRTVAGNRAADPTPR
jgi:uncharacterized protein